MSFSSSKVANLNIAHLEHIQGTDKKQGQVGASYSSVVTVKHK